MPQRLFFPASIAAFERITHTFAFHDPCVVGLWTLRNHVTSFLESNPEASQDDINQAFVQGSGVRSADLKRACVQATWESQQAEFAGLLLVTLVAQYESFVSHLMTELGIDSRGIEQQLSYATKHSKKTSYGVRTAIAAITELRSEMLQTAYYPLLVQHKKNSLATLDALMSCYRYFKECRNCYIHNGRLGSAALQRAHAKFQRVAKPSSLGVKETPEHFPATVNGPVRVTLRGVAGFGDVLFRLVATLDAELSQAQAAEEVFVARWKRAVGQSVTLSNTPSKRLHELRRLLQSMQMPVPNNVGIVERFLIDRGLVAAAPAPVGTEREPPTTTSPPSTPASES